jgi:hypothetical protein
MHSSTMRTRTRRTRPRRRTRPTTRRTRPGTRRTANCRGGSSIQPTITEHIAAITLQTRL